MYDDYMLCKVTLGVLKGASKLNVLLLLLFNSLPIFAPPDNDLGYVK